MNNYKLAELAITSLKICYKEAACSLIYENELQLLISARLSAKCKDARVNNVTPALFSQFKNLEDFCKADILKIENIIKPCGLYKTKAIQIIGMCKMLKKVYNSKIPDNIQELIKLPGIGRKIANLIVGEIFKKPAVIVDTHCFRITKRLGLQNENNEIKAEAILRKILPKEESRDFCHRLVVHGRLVCRIKPICENCCMNSFCKKHITQNFANT
ncbi:MAG: endonuclease III [Oscillospiraceae bacterium]|jgi:endonuclease-3|nr:endonuclease III [Oscillospiraceae bacterium]